MTPLPIDPVLPEVSARLAKARRLVLVAEPGAGKSTRLPPHLAADGPTLLLEPRRVAARALARRIAAERGWEVGAEVGWQVRFERRFCADTRLLVATEGILAARAAADPFLSDFTTIVLDEFHERSLHADLALALAREAARARDDLRLVVMSATLDAQQVAEYLGEDGPCPVVEVPGRPHPVEVDHRPRQGAAEAAAAMLDEVAGDVLVFLPGARDIQDAARQLEGRVPASVHPLYGALPPAEQEAALRPGAGRKVILATNLAETSLTVEGVTGVVDLGLHKLLRFDPSIELDRLETERIGADSAAQRAGRAGRLGPGVAWRLWERGEILRPHRQPEVARVDLASTALTLLSWGGDPRTFEWFEAPPEAHLDQAMEVLARLGATQQAGGRARLTDRGAALARLPLSPRLARLLQAAGGDRRAAQLAALLSEGGRLGPELDLARAAASSSDALVLLDRFDRAGRGVHQAARHLERAARRVATETPADDDTLRRALLAAFPDRVARRREPGSPRLHLARGHGAVLSRTSTVQTAELLVALDVRARRGDEALVHLASAVEADWLEGVEVVIEHRFDPDKQAVRAFRVRRYMALTLGEHPAPLEPAEASRVLAEAAWQRRDQLVPEGLRARLAFAGVELDLRARLAEACLGRADLPRPGFADLVPPQLRRQAEEAAPTHIDLPSGRRAKLEYRADGTVAAAAKLQELFGLAESPRLGPHRRPVLLSLLAPNGRAVQQTDDLTSFWQTTYPQVRKELRGRYPKHPWPEDPWTAEATHRTKRRPRR